MREYRKQDIKRFFAMTLAFILLISVTPTGVFASTTAHPDAFTFTVRDENGVSVNDAVVKYTLVSGNDIIASVDNLYTSDGEVAIDLSAYEDTVSGGNVEIRYQVKKDGHTSVSSSDVITNVTDNIDVSLIRNQFQVSFAVNGDGAFRVTSGQQMQDNKIIANRNDDVSFTFEVGTGYDIQVYDGNTLLGTNEGLYTINSIIEHHSISAVTRDITAPIISNVNVSDAGVWKSSKTISFDIDDNSGTRSDAYISKTLYADCASLKAPGTDVIGLDSYSYVVREEGTYYIYAVDASNNFSCSQVTVEKIDVSEPTINSVAVSDRWDKDSNIVSVTVSDNNAVHSVYYSRNAEYGTDAILINQVADSDVYKFEASENGNYYIFVFDEAMNVSSEGLVVNYIDTTEPRVTGVVKNPNEEWSNSAIIVRGTVTDVQTTGLTGGSGINKVYYNSDADQNISEATYYDGEFTFVIPNIDFNGKYYVWAVDNTGRESDKWDINVKIQNTLPDNASVMMEEPNGINDWYVEEYPSIRIVEPVVDEMAASVITKYMLWNTSNDESEATAETVVFNGANHPVISADGEYVLVVWTEDIAGNTCADNVVIRRNINVDISAPTDLSIIMNDTSIVAENQNVITFDTFYNNTATIKLTADCGLSGINKLEYQMVRNVSEYSEDANWKTYNPSGITVSPTQKFILYFRATDNAGNNAVVCSTGVIIDDKAPEGNEHAAPNIILSPSGTGINSGSVNVSINVVEPRYLGDTPDTVNGFYSGLSNVSYRIYASDLSETVTGTLFVRGGSGTEVDGDNLVRTWSGNVTVDSNTFNSNNVFVEVTAIDNAGNSRTTSTSAIMIDTTAPRISVHYNNNEPVAEQYYNQDRVATVSITERNFSADAVNITITNTDGAEPVISEWVKSGGSGNQDDSVWTATISYQEDGDYTFAIEFTDMAGNVCTDKSFAAGTANPTEFTIDKTAPVVTVSYDNNDVKNDKYFNAHRTAEIVVYEHNFSSELIQFSQSASLDGTNFEAPNVTWRSDGDNHIGTISYTEDGDYTFDIVTVADIAGNEHGEVDYTDSEAAKEFTIDTKIGKQEEMIAGISNGVAYGYDDTIAPIITCEDTNFDSYVIELFRTRKDEIMIPVTDAFINTIDSDSGVVSDNIDFDKIQDNDGIYTLKVTMTDKAGNEKTEEIRFVVNRFGSVYEYKEYLIGLVKDGGAYKQSIEEDIILIEYNADRLLEGSVVIGITCDGKPLENVKFTVDPVVNDKVKTGNSGWYEYNYTISKDNFNADGVYKISVLSKDQKNESENNNYEDKGIMFRVDNTAPEITSITGLEESIINDTERKVNYVVYDTIGLKAVTIYVDGKQYGEAITTFGDDVNNYEGTFTLKESTAVQNVRIVVEDLAGNITDTAEESFSSVYTFNENVTISTNFFVRWLANTPLVVGTVGGVAAVGAGTVGAISFRRRRKLKK